MSLEKKILAGEVVIFSCGEYDDYEIMAIVTTLCDIDIREEIEEYNRLQDDSYKWKMADDFAKWMEMRGKIRIFEHREFNFESYGKKLKMN